MVSAKSGSPAAQNISNRPLILDVTSRESYDQTRQWLQYCQSHHKCLPISETLFPPTRVIDVGTADGIPRLLEHCDHPGPYAALSYCWGSTEQSVLTRVHNIRDFFVGIPVSKLQQTIKDAITTTRELGLQFLWIDSLCIIQDSVEDKIKELKQMHEVYRNAYVTIVAASAHNCDEGFLHLRRQLPDNRVTRNIAPFRLPYRSRDGTLDEVFFQPLQRFQPALEPINKRGWTLQESILSPRLLIYGSQLVRQCYGVPATDFGLQRWKLETAGSAARNPPSPKLPPRELENINYLQQLQGYWSRVVNDYSTRQLGRIEDKLIAISAIARQLSATAFRNHSYQAGLWLPHSPTKTSFLYDLCWSVRSPLASQQAPYLAPSWSWASGHVQTSLGIIMKNWWSLTEPFDLSHTPDVIECTVDSEGSDPFGLVRGGSLTIRCPLRKASVLRDTKNESVFEVKIVGNKRTEVSELDLLLSFAAANPSETVNLSRADKTRKISSYDICLSASFDAIFPELREDPLCTSIWCLRLLRDAGLLVRPVDDGVFHRVGSFHETKVFRPVNDDGHSLPDECLGPFSLAQVTIL